MGFLKSKVRSFQEMLARRHNVRAHFWQSLANYIQMGGGLVTSVVLARLLLPEDFGRVAYATAAAALALLPLNWTLTPSIVADGGRDEVLYRRAWALGWTLMAFRILVVLACGGWFLFEGKSTEAGLVLLMGLPMAVSEPVSIWRCDWEAVGQFKLNTWSTLWVVGFSGLSSACLALMGTGAWAIALPGPLTLLGQMWIYGRQRRRPVVWSLRGTGLRRVLGEGFWIWAMSLGEVALLRVDKAFLGRWSDPTALGNYNRAFNFTPLSHQVLNSLMTNATISAIARARGAEAKRRLFAKASAIVLAGAVVSGLGWWFLADPLVPWVFGPQWREAVPAFRALSGLSLAYAVSYLPVMLLIQGRQYRWITVVRVGTLVLFVVYLWVRREHLDAIAVAWMLQATLILQGICFALPAWRVLNREQAET